MSAESLKIRIPEHLPIKQRRVLEMIAQGKPCKSMGQNEKTAEWHRMRLQDRCNLHNVADLTKLALRLGLAEVDV